MLLTTKVLITIERQCKPLHKTYQKAAFYCNFLQVADELNKNANCTFNSPVVLLQAVNIAIHITQYKCIKRVILLHSHVMELCAEAELIHLCLWVRAREVAGARAASKRPISGRVAEALPRGAGPVPAVTPRQPPGTPDKQGRENRDQADKPSRCSLRRRLAPEWIILL